MAEHFITALLTAANTVSASPSLSTAACSPPRLLGEVDRELTVMKHFPAKRKKKEVIFSSTSSQSRSFHNHTHICASRAERAELKQVVRAAAADARSTSKNFLVRQVKQGSVRGLRCCCSLWGHCKDCFMLSVLDKSGLGWISLWQCLTHQWLEKEAKWLCA